MQENESTTRSCSPKLTSREVDYIAEAISASRQSTHDRIKIGCVITTNRGEYLSEGFNKAKSHPLQAKYNNRVNRIAPSQFIHAEMDAVSKLPSDAGDGLIAYVGRLDCNGEYAMCRPCKACTAALLDRGVQTVFYTEADGKVTKYGL